MDEFDFDNDTNFSTSINSLKNKINDSENLNNKINNSENLNNKINNSENLNNKFSIDDILNHRSHIQDTDTFPCLTNKCKQYSIQSNSKNSKNSKNTINTKNTKNIINNNIKKKEIEKTDNIYIILAILFLLFNNYDLYLYLQNKGFSYYKSLIFRLIGFISVFYLINKINI